MKTKQIICTLLTVLILLSTIPMIIVHADNYSAAQLSGISNTVISNSTASNYVNAAMRYYLRTNSRVKSNLDNNTSVVFFFDGCSDNVFSGSFNYTSNHMSAYVAVVQLRNGVPTIIYENENASTIPDNPRMVNNTTAGNSGTDVPTVIDGIHNISSVNHQGKYAALHIHDSGSSVNVIRCNSTTYYASTSSGINAHARGWDYVSTSTYSSTGCFNIGKTSPATEYNDFMYAVTGISNAKSNTFSSTGKDMGIIIVDRYMYKSTLNNIYGDSALVNQLTEYSSNIAPSIQNNQNAPSAPVVNVNKTLASVGESITITWTNSENVDYYWLTCWSSSEHVINQEVSGNSYTFTLPYVDTFGITVVAYNGIGEATGNWKYIKTYNSAPSAPVVNVDKTLASVGENITITWTNSENAEYYWLTCWSNSEHVINQEVSGNSYTFTLPYVDTFGITVVACNDLGDTTGNWKYIKTYNSAPSAPVVSVDKTSASVGENITITWTNSENAEYYWLTCWSKTEHVINQKANGNSYTFTLPYVDTFGITVVAYNDLGNTTGNWNYITVECTTHSWNNGDVTKTATCTTDGEKTYTCTVCGTKKTEPIPATGHKDENNDGKCDNCGITLLKITKQPASATGELNKGVNFKVEATGEGALGYKWQKSTDGGETWADLAGKTTDTLTSTASLANDGVQYRCVVTDANGSVTSNAATLRTAQVNITKHPGGQIGQLNKGVNYKIEVTGDNVSIQWQKSTDGGKTWTDIAGKTGNLLTATASNANHGAYYRCKVTDKNGLSVYSKAAILKVAQVNITKQPGGRIGQLNKNVNYEVTVTGENVTYLWQKSTDGGKTWKDLAGYTNAKLTALSSLANNGAYYRCKVTDKNGLSVYSSSAILRVAQLNVTAQPKSVSAAAGTKATFSVTVTGDNVGYQWQKSTDGGKTWANLTGYTKSAFTITLRADHNGVRYRCVLTDKAGVAYNSNVATVTVK